MIAPSAREGASQASKPCRTRNKPKKAKTLTGLRREFLIVAGAWGDTQPGDQVDFEAESAAVLAQVKAMPIATTEDASVMMDIALQQACWTPGNKDTAFDLLHEVACYLRNVGDRV